MYGTEGKEGTDGTEGTERTEENDTPTFMEGKTLRSICDDIYLAVESHTDIDQEDVIKICDKLKQYRWIRHIDELHVGKHTRWLKRGTHSLAIGGVVVGVHETDDGPYVQLLSYARQTFQYRFDDCSTFQKLSDQEIIVLLAQETLHDA